MEDMLAGTGIEDKTTHLTDEWDMLPSAPCLAGPCTYRPSRSQYAVAGLCLFQGWVHGAVDSCCKPIALGSSQHVAGPCKAHCHCRSRSI